MRMMAVMSPCMNIPIDAHLRSERALSQNRSRDLYTFYSSDHAVIDLISGLEHAAQVQYPLNTLTKLSIGGDHCWPGRPLGRQRIHGYDGCSFMTIAQVCNL